MAFARFLAFFILFGIFGLPEAKCQIYKISGRIVDSETLEPLPYAHVFIDQTTIGAVSDFNGEFVIDNLANGEYKLVYSFVGYELFYKLVTINDKDARASVRLIPQKGELQNVEVKGTRDKEWEGRLRQFNKIFFGDNEFASACKILNPWVLEFDYDSKEKKLKATASAPLEIENRALGYSLICNLLGFVSDKRSYKIRGLYKFDELNTLDTKEAARWTRNRRQAYHTSLRFLMKSIVENHVRENGFGLYRDNRPAVYNSQTGMFSIELEKKNVSVIDMHNNLKPTGRPGYYTLNFDSRIEIHHTNQFARNKIYRDVPYPISWIEVANKTLTVNESGLIVNSDDVVTSGELNLNRVAAMLPLDYSPGAVVVINYLTKRSIAKRLQERTFLITDKTIYHPDEQIWFKAHIAFANQSVRDSLSKVLYVDLINERMGVVQTKMVRLDSAGGHGSFCIPKDVKSGQYFLRAYTQWMLNYGPAVHQYMPVVIADNDISLSISNNVMNSQSSDFTWDISDAADSTILQVILDSLVNKEPAICSIAIAPSENTLVMSPSIKDLLTFEEDLPDGTLSDFIHPLEMNFSLRGRIIHPKKGISYGKLTVIQGRMDSLYYLESNRRGNFVIDQLDFEGITEFSFQARNRKGRIFGKTELIPKDKPRILAPSFKISLDTVQLTRPVQLTKPLLDSIPPKSNNLEGIREESTNNVAFDYVLTNDDLERMPSGQSIVTALQGRVPGLHYDFTGKGLLLKGNGLGSGERGEPLFVVDGVPLFQQQTLNQPVANEVSQRQPSEDQVRNVITQNSIDGQTSNQDPSLLKVQTRVPSSQMESSATEVISHLTVSNVSRVEITTRMDTRYGSLGTNGVIAIYTKKVQGRGDVKPFDVFQVEGFAKPLPFSQAVNYSGHPPAEYTPTWYWNPDVQISSTQFTQIKFPTLPKGVVFRVSINGVTKAGTPVSGSFLLNGGNTKPVSASLDQRQK